MENYLIYNPKYLLNFVFLIPSVTGYKIIIIINRVVITYKIFVMSVSSLKSPNAPYIIPQPTITILLCHEKNTIVFCPR